MIDVRWHATSFPQAEGQPQERKGRVCKVNHKTFYAHFVCFCPFCINVCALGKTRKDGGWGRGRGIQTKKEDRQAGPYIKLLAVVILASCYAFWMLLPIEAQLGRRDIT